MDKFQSTAKQLEVAAMSLGTPHTMAPDQDAVVKPQKWLVEDVKAEKIPRGEKRRVVFRLVCSGILSGSEKWLPSFRISNKCRTQPTLDAGETCT